MRKAFSEKISSFNVDDKVASEGITINDDGLLEGGLNTNPWDGEGTPHQKTEIIKDGIFQKRLYDEKYAILENTESTGNGVRSIYGAVDNGVSNFQIYPGDITLEEMISNIKDGYLIEKFSWLNPDELSGFFGAEIRNGYYIKNGEIKNPIKLGNVSGNVLEMVKNCQYISKEKMEHDLKVAKDIQMEFLPKDIVKIKDIEIDFNYSPAKFIENSLLPYIAFSNLTVSF